MHSHHLVLEELIEEAQGLARLLGTIRAVSDVAELALNVAFNGVW